MANMSLKGIRKAFGNLEVLHGIDLDIEDGEFTVLVGPSGCGKSTLLRLLAGLDTITSGEFLIDGDRMNDVPPADRGIGMVFQSYALYQHMTVAENISFGLRLQRTPKAEIADKVTRTAKLLQLDHLLDRKPKHLSGGQRQRVAIARALILEPDVLLLDEPTSALDVSVQAEILNLLTELKARRKLTYILVSHDLAVVDHMCDRLAVMERGQVVEILDRSALVSNGATHPYARQLIAASLEYDRVA